MTTSKFTDLMHYLISENCAQVSQPFYYKDEGPFIVALEEAETGPRFFCFLVTGTAEFLAKPDTFPQAFTSEEFLSTISEHLDLDKLYQTGKYYRIDYNKAVPDEKKCRLALQKVWDADPKAAGCVVLVGKNYSMLAAPTLCSKPGLLS